MNHSQRTQKGKQPNLALKRRLRTNMTPAEKRLWGMLRSKQLQSYKFLRQHGIGPYIVDFFCPERSLVVEVDGDVHAEPINQTKDAKREEYLRSVDLDIVRYSNHEVLNNLDGVLEHLLEKISEDSTSPSPSLQRRGYQKATIEIKDHNTQHPPNPLPRTFFDRPTLTVAKDLLGKYLVCECDASRVMARIVDVEAYIGQVDLACHASKGRTKRTEVLFGPAGMTYVYLIYGMYDLLNFVTERIDYPAAILIRGIEVFGHSPDIPVRRIDGPGRLTRFLQIDRSHHQLDATLGQSLWIEDHQEKVLRKHIQASPRIGVDYAGKWAKKPWRFRLSEKT